MHLPWTAPTPSHLGPYPTNLPPLAAPVTVANTVAETTIYTAGLPRGFFNKGVALDIRGFGYHSASGSPKIQIRVYKGATLLADTGLNSSGVSTNDLVELRVMIAGQSISSVWTQGFYSEIGGGVNSFPMVNTAATTINIAGETLKITVTWDTASSLDTITWTGITAYLSAPT